MKLDLLTRKLTTVYLLLALCAYLTVGCLRQPTEVISQSDEKAKKSLIAAKNSSSFNYFEQKKKVSAELKPGRVKLGPPTALAQSTPDPEAEKPGRNQISQASFEESERQKQAEAEATAENKPVKQVAEPTLEDWRSKSLIASAKKYPSKLMNACQQNTERIQQASGSISKELTQGFKRLTGGAQEQSIQKDPFLNQIPSDKSADQLLEQELDRILAQSDRRPNQKQPAQSAGEPERNLRQADAGFGEISQEMRRMQINSIMDRARHELKEKNYEYAQFLAEQALETSYRGHVAFGLDEESPQMLLQQVKTELAMHQPANLKQMGHSDSQVQPSGGQQGAQFTPSRVHPLKRRAQPPAQTQTAKPRTRQLIPQQSGGSELPLIVPRNTGTTPVSPSQPAYQQPPRSSGSISLEPPAFGPAEEEPVDLPPIEHPVQRETKRVPSEPAIKLELEAAPDEPPTRIRLSDPEPVAEEPVNVPEQKTEAPAGSGPQLMLPKLPSVSGDLTSQTDSNGKTPATMTSSVKVRAPLQEQQPAEPSPFVEQNPAENQASAGQGGAGLQLDDIEWDLEERKRPAPKSAWGGMTTLLLIAGGLIILLLSAIVVVLLRRGASSTSAKS